MNDDNERLAHGARWFEAVYGEGTSEGLVGMQTGLAQDLARLGIEFNFGDIYARPGLTLAQRELLTLASLVTLGGLEPQLRGHTRGAIRVGCTPTEILETVIHVVQYAGFPRALNAIRVVTDQLLELGLELPAPLGPTTAPPPAAPSASTAAPADSPTPSSPTAPPASPATGSPAESPTT